jgi:ribonucleoside-diphosphate reductase alpha chain
LGYTSKENIIFETEMSSNIFQAKYMLEGETQTYQSKQRILNVVGRYYPEILEELDEAIIKKWVGLAGGIWRSAENPSKNVSSINCTTLEQPEDNLESINEAWYWWAKFAAYGQGEGVDLSKLRPKGSVVHNSSRESTGAVSFMHTFDGILNVIAQQGRRGASLISLSIKHPDIPDFIHIKDEDGVLETANISIHITNDFMEAIKNDKDWEFEFKNKYETIKKTTKARKLFREIAEHAWKSGDPGVQYIDNVRKFSNSDYLGYPVISTNACSEQWLDAHNVCLLSSINLAKFEEYGEGKYKRLIYLMTLLLNAFRKYEIEEERSPSPLQLEKLKKLPRIGLGVTGLADFFINKKIAYASKESMKEVEKVFGLLAGEAYKCSYEIAKQEGSFELYDKKKYKKSPFIQNLLNKGWIEDYHLDYQAHVCKTTIAPNGTLTEIVEAGGGGVEPIFAKYFVRRERSTTNDWKEWFTYNHAVRKEINRRGIELNKENVDNELSEDFWITAHTVNNKDKIDMMSVIQQYIDSAISVTYNLKEDAKIKDIEDIYFYAWEKEIKNISVYREGSKAGVLITDANYEQTKNEEEPQKDDKGRPITIERVNAPKRPEQLKCDIHQISVNKEKHIVLIGKINDGSIYEIFVTPNTNKEIDLGEYKEGIIKKVKKGHYQLIVQNGEEKCIIDNIGKQFDQTYASLSRFISMGLRHGVDLEFIVTQLQKDTSFTSFEKAVARVLKKYIKEGEKVKISEICPICDSTNLIYKEGCLSCADCGYSKCD